MKKIKEAVMNEFKHSKKKTLKTIILIVAFISIGYLMLVSFLYAAVPQRINYQGKLLNSAGEPVTDGNRNITFRLFNVSSGGGALWSETQSVNTQGGLFNVILGSVSAISLDFNQDYWLEVQVSGDGAMSPRHRLVSVPYSFRAEDANNSEQLNSQSAGYYLDASNINAGTLNDARLSANVTRLGANIDASEITTNIVSSIDGVSNDGGNIDLVAGSNITITPNDVANNITIAANTSGDNLGNHTATQNLRMNGHYISGDGGNEGIYVNNAGNVGVGITLPDEKVHINGTLKVTTDIFARSVAEDIKGKIDSYDVDPNDDSISASEVMDALNDHTVHKLSEKIMGIMLYMWAGGFSIDGLPGSLGVSSYNVFSGDSSVDVYSAFFRQGKGVKIERLLHLVPQNSAPTPAEEGMIYSNSSDHHLYYYNGSIWKQLD